MRGLGVVQAVPQCALHGLHGLARDLHGLARGLHSFSDLDGYFSSYLMVYDRFLFFFLEHADISALHVISLAHAFLLHACKKPA